MKSNPQFVDAISLPIEQPQKLPGTEEIYVVMNPYAGESSSCGNAFQQFRDSQEAVIYYEPPTEDKPDKTVIAPAYPTMQPEGVRYVNSYQEYRLIVVSETLWRANCSTLEEEEELAQILMTLMDSYREISQARERLMFGAVDDPYGLDEVAEMVAKIDAEIARVPRQKDLKGGSDYESNENEYQIMNVQNKLDQIEAEPDFEEYERLLATTQSLSQVTKNLMQSHGIPKFVILALDGFARKEYREDGLNEIYWIVHRAEKIPRPSSAHIELLFNPLARYFFRGDAATLAYLYTSCAICEAQLRELFNEKVENYNQTNNIAEDCSVSSRIMKFDFTAREVEIIMRSCGLPLVELCGRGDGFSFDNEKRKQLEEIKTATEKRVVRATKVFQDRYWGVAELMGIAVARKGAHCYTTEIGLAFENVLSSVMYLLDNVNENGEIVDVPYKSVVDLLTDLQQLRRSILI